jgi:hypothetical protein
MEQKICARCYAPKPLSEFHRQPKGPMGRHSWCKPCANAAQKATRDRNYSPEQKRRWSLATRYGITPQRFDEMLAAQHGLCAICGKEPARACIDHDHATGRVRAILCHRCNIKLPAVESAEFLQAALAYLARFKS